MKKYHQLYQLKIYPYPGTEIIPDTMGQVEGQTSLQKLRSRTIHAMLGCALKKKYEYHYPSVVFIVIWIFRSKLHTMVEWLSRV